MERLAPKVVRDLEERGCEKKKVAGLGHWPTGRRLEKPSSRPKKYRCWLFKKIGRCVKACWKFGTWTSLKRSCEERQVEVGASRSLFRILGLLKEPWQRQGMPCLFFSEVARCLSFQRRFVFP